MPEDPTLQNVFAGVQAAVAKRGTNVAVLDVSRFSGVTDYYLIVSGSSDRRVQTIAQAILDALGERGLRVLGVEGLSEGKWVLVDFGSWVAHVFYEEVRDYYDLEGLWFDAPRVPIPPEVLNPPPGAGDAR